MLATIKRDQPEGTPLTIGYVAGWSSIIGNVILFCLKMWIGLNISSIAIMADAWHTLSDSITSILVLVGLWMIAKPADKKHPFGHGRVELIASLIIGVLLAVVALNFFYESVGRFQKGNEVTYSTWAMIVFALSVVAKELMAQIALWAYRKTENRSFKADAWHHRSDAIASGIILVGMLVGGSIPWIDAVMGIVVSILIIHVAYCIIMEAVHPLLGEQVDDDLERGINNIARELLGEGSSPHHIHMHRYGGHTEISLHIMLTGDLSLSVIHERVAQLENRLRSELGVEATIHVDPRLPQTCH